MRQSTYAGFSKASACTIGTGSRQAERCPAARHASIAQGAADLCELACVRVMSCVLRLF